MDTLWFDASNDLRKLSSENTHPRYGKCKHFCGSSARTERRFWVDSRQLLDGSIVLPARVGTLNDQTIFRVSTRMLMSGGWSRWTSAERKECIPRGSWTWPALTRIDQLRLFTRKYRILIGVCSTESGKCSGRESNRYIHGNEIIDSPFLSSCPSTRLPRYKIIRN